ATDDSWIRDYGPIFVVNGRGELACHDFRFNSWGCKYPPWDRDDDAAEPAAVIAHACRLLGTAPPPLLKFAAAALSPMAQSFWAENRLVRNDRIKRELGVTLRYPDYRAGLKALLAEEAGALK
ncbi:MAG: agmatine deiminase family protein, partial [Alphaproteobacteria bacterium]|nr:agmatine deiminase family protein [Alphaproteobacteria bacterium]